MSAPLMREIKRRIEAAGPIGVADYMQLALAHPEHGYYATRDPFGAKGDFVTAPEISQMFGEVIGLWAAHMWGALGRPSPFALVELGPGRGTLMADMLRAGRLAPGFTEAARVHLVETSPALRRRQRAALREAAVPVSWFETLAAVPAGPTILVANEFFDALPVRQYVRTGEGWRERTIGINASGKLAWRTAESRAETHGKVGVILAEQRRARPGMVAEISPQRADMARQIGSRLALSGAALIVDYGYSARPLGDTFQAVKRHSYADPLSDPGNADLTAHVDFSALCAAARRAGARAFGPITQGQFLTALGIRRRAEKLKEINAERAAEIDAAVARLTGADAMGSLFKVVAFTGPDGPVPPPFAD